MKINNNLKKKINNSVVRIIAEDININWKIPYLQNEPSKGQGTGFFINTNGYILTCSHVVNGAKNIYIEVPNKSGEKHKCDIISICPYFDIALIKTKTYKPKEYLLLGNSDKLEVGSEVYVVGYPVSYGPRSNSVNNIKYTLGIISGQQYGLIQTDSSINPGNSGGPLFYKDKIIGINSRKLIGDSLENIGYSVPINNYKIIKNNFDEKIIYRPDLLFNYNNTDEKVLSDLTNGKVKRGIIVSKIYKSSILKKSNIKKGSIITEINGYKIDNYGLVDFKWLGTQIDINILLNKFSNNSSIKIKYFEKTKMKKIDSNKTNIFIKKEEKIKLVPYIPYIRIMYPVFEKIPFLIIGGMIFMNFTINSLQYNDSKSLELMEIYSKKDDIIKPKLFISFIFPNTKVNILNNIKANNFVNKINDINTHTLNEMINALKKPLIINNKEYIKIEVENEQSVILSVDEIIEQDKIFSEIYNYPLNKFHRKYINLDK